LVPPEADPEKIIKKGKASKIGFSAATTSASGQLPDSTLDTPIVLSNNLPLSSTEVSKKIYFEEFLVEYSTFETEVKKENIDIFSFPDIEKSFSLDSFEYFPTLGFATPLSVKTFVSKEVGTSSPSQTLPSSSKTPLVVVKTEISPLFFSPSPNLHIAQPPSPASSPRIQNQMAVFNPPTNRMDAIVAARYAPLVFPQPMNSLPPGDYLKYMPTFTEEEDITVEEHLATFYSYVDNQNIENEDVWMRVFI
jgi:hypothetical protein